MLSRNRVLLQYANQQCTNVVKRNLAELKQILAEKFRKEIEVIKKFKQKHGKSKISEINVNMIYGGMRGILALLCETSELDPNEGIRFRGYTIPECQKLLPKAKGGCEPLPEGIFWLMLTGEIPTKAQTSSVSKEWATRSNIPDHVLRMLNNFPPDLHPMSQFSCAMTALNKCSKFNEAYNSKKVPKNKFWEYAYEDAMDIIGKQIVVAAIIYNNCFHNGKQVCDIDRAKDWSHNFTYLIGYDDPQFTELMRLYLTIHSDHEGGNVSAHTCHLVASAFSDPYLSFAAALNGLAGPLHGLANQEVLLWILQLKKELGEDPSDDKLKEFVLKTLKSGQVIPGYGHAVLRKTDPRYVCQREYAQKHLPDDPVFKLVSQLYNVVPPVLQSLGKVANPWPNVDAHSGVLLQYYGMKEMQYYTVLFGLSRALGVLASLILARGLNLPIERPKSISSKSLMKRFTTQQQTPSAYKGQKPPADKGQKPSADKGQKPPAGKVQKQEKS